MEKPDMFDCTEKQFNSWYWSEYNELCINCTNECKQSKIANIQCLNFKKKGE